APPAQYYCRVRGSLVPFHRMPPPGGDSDPVIPSHVWIPTDDDPLVTWCFSSPPTRALTADELAEFRAGSSIHVMDYAPATSEAYGDIRPVQNRANDYLADWEAQRTRKFFGVPGVGAQDKAITESQGAYDRSLERLGRADLGIIRVRRCLLDAARALRERGITPPGREAESYRVRPAAVLLPKDVPWGEGGQGGLTIRPSRPPSGRRLGIGTFPPKRARRTFPRERRSSRAFPRERAARTLIGAANEVWTAPLA